jgi:hypothetical protein
MPAIGVSRRGVYTKSREKESAKNAREYLQPTDIAGSVDIYNRKL